ncbi:hypothetical protein WOLCODRAFT_84034, partial [Wolfiporia cocos MD-104 SS10]
HLDQALYHILEAHICTFWHLISGVRNLCELQEQLLEALCTLASLLIKEHAGANTITILKSDPNGADELQIQASSFMHDTFQYVVLDRAIKYGNIGIMEGMVPHLLFRFICGHNSNYTIECLESTVSHFADEWPPAVRDYVRKHCWLINNTGKRDGFSSIDRAQERQIADIKVTHRSQGPSIDWDYLRKLHPAIPVIQAVSTHMRSEFATWKRYKRHTSPGDKQGINQLDQVYSTSKLHVTHPLHQAPPHNEAGTYYDDGILTLKKTMTRWIDAQTFERSTEQDWDSIIYNRCMRMANAVENILHILRCTVPSSRPRLHRATRRTYKVHPLYPLSHRYLRRPWRRCRPGSSLRLDRSLWLHLSTRARRKCERRRVRGVDEHGTRDRQPAHRLLEHRQAGLVRARRRTACTRPSGRRRAGVVVHHDDQLLVRVRCGCAS